METQVVRTHVMLLERRELSHGCFVLRLERGDLRFEPGQYVILGAPGWRDRREYSVYSGPDDPFLELLVKEIPEGLVSRKLHALDPGDTLEVEGPLGYFTIPSEARADGRFLFVATGTGIAPFHCFARAYPQLDYHLLHGVRHATERHEHESYPPERYTACVTGEPGGDYRGRVTHYLQRCELHPDTLCYLCGNCDMIFEAFDILQRRGVAPEHLHAEVYF